MSDRRATLARLTAAADRLTEACTAHINAGQLVQDPAPPTARILRHAFGAATLTPTDMLKQLGRMK